MPLVWNSGIRDSCSREVVGNICCKEELEGRGSTCLEQGKGRVGVSKIKLKFGDAGVVFVDLFEEVFVGKGLRPNGLTEKAASCGDLVCCRGVLQISGRGWILLGVGFVVKVSEVGCEEGLVDDIPELKERTKKSDFITATTTSFV